MNIYVGNLSYDVTETELKNLFAEFGEVTSAKIIEDRDTGRPKGFAFVEMANQAEGEAAITALNEKELKGREIKVNQARPREDRPRV
jgi:RNA recognition motif-containing protein